MSTTDIRCKLCGAQDTCEEVPRFTYVNKRVFFGLGIVPSLLYAASRKTNLRCTSCGGTFAVRTPWATVCLVLFWGLVAALISILAVCFSGT